MCRRQVDKTHLHRLAVGARQGFIERAGALSALRFAEASSPYSRDEQGFPFDIWVNYFGELLPLVLPVLSRGKADGGEFPDESMEACEEPNWSPSYVAHFFIGPKIVAAMVLSIVAFVCVISWSWLPLLHATCWATTTILTLMRSITGPTTTNMEGGTATGPDFGGEHEGCRNFPIRYMEPARVGKRRMV